VEKSQNHGLEGQNKLLISGRIGSALHAAFTGSIALKYKLEDETSTQMGVKTVIIIVSTR
jgi:hypothetical protein